jgi:hypothetical protein
VDRQENAVFIPASAGKPFVVPYNLTASQLAHIYTGATMKGAVDGEGFLISGLGHQFKENTSRRFLCPEIEVAKGNKELATVAVQRWLGQVVRDGSLPSTGFELNVMPTQGDLFIRLVNEVCGALESGGSAVDGSCGLHVHVDARDFDYMDIRKLVLLYELVEPAIFAMLPNSRHISRYCQPCGYRFASHLRAGENLSKEDVAADDKDKKKYDLKAPVHSMVYGKSGKVTRNGKYGAGQAHEVRYMGLNLYSWYYRGSVEFRHAAGTIEPNDVIDWALICTGLLDTAMSLREKSIPSLAGEGVAELVKGSHDLYKCAFGKKGSDTGLLKDSISLLKDCVQDRCKPYIDKHTRAILSGKSTIQTKLGWEDEIQAALDELSDDDEEDDD